MTPLAKYRWLTLVTHRDPQGSEQPGPVVTRESAPVSVVWDAVLGFLSSAGGHETLYAHSGGLMFQPQKTDTLSLLGQMGKIHTTYYNELDVTYFLSLKRLELIWCFLCFFPLLDGFHCTFAFQVFPFCCVHSEKYSVGLGCHLLVTNWTCLSSKSNQKESSAYGMSSFISFFYFLSSHNITLPTCATFTSQLFTHIICGWLSKMYKSNVQRLGGIHIFLFLAFQSFIRPQNIVVWFVLA